MASRKYSVLQPPQFVIEEQLGRLIKTHKLVVEENNRAPLIATADSVWVFHQEVSLNSDGKDVRQQRGRDRNRPNCSSSEGAKKNSETRKGAAGFDHEMDSRAQSKEEVMPQDHPSKKSEIDLSRSSPRINLRGGEAKPRAGKEREVIRVQSRAEAILEAVEKPLEKSPPRE